MSEQKQAPANLGRYCTYKVFDPDIQKYIYVGMTSNLPQRIKQHGQKSPWWKANLRFDLIKGDMDEAEAAKDEKHWTQYYADRGHSLNNRQNKTDREFDRMVIMKSWLEEDPETSDEEKEAILLTFVKGRDFLAYHDEEDMECHSIPLWDHIYNAIRTATRELEKTHGIHLTHMDIARLAAKSVGLEVDEVQE